MNCNRIRPSIGILLGCAVVICAPTAALADPVSPVDTINEEAATADIKLEPIRSNVSVLTGSGGNITVFSGAHGKLMVDAGIALSKDRIAADLDRISAMPVKYVIDTHWHWDHTDGNAWLHQRGAVIVAQRNTLQRLTQSVRVEDWTHTFPPAPKAARPTILVADRKTMKFEGETFEIESYGGPAHTDTDVSVYLKTADVLATGDTWWNGVYPMIDIVTGGSIDGMIRAANANIARASDKTIIVPGHGPVGTRDQLIAYRDMLVHIRANVAELKNSGKSLADTIAAKPTAAYDAKWGGFVIGPDFFTSLVYRSI